MSFKSKFTLIVLSATLAVYTIAGAWLATRAQQPANDPGAQQKIFESVLKHIQDDYVDEPNMEKFRNGAPGSEAKLRILRANSLPLTVAVKRGAVRAPAAEGRMEAGKIGVLRINSLDNGEAADARARLQDLMKQGAQKIVLDLRSV